MKIYKVYNIETGDEVFLNFKTQQKYFKKIIEDMCFDEDSELEYYKIHVNEQMDKKYKESM